MKIYLSHSSKIDYINNLYRPIRESELGKNHEFVYFCDDPEYSSKSSRDVIRSCDVLIAEMSECSTGMGIEIGWADSFDIRIFVVYRDGSDIKGYMSSIAEEIIKYIDTSDLISKLSEVIQKG